MKTTFFLLTVLLTFSVQAQKKIVTKTATVSFEGSVKSFEPVEAVNDNVTVVMDGNGNLAALALIRGFSFPIALMEEHFNENYMQSEIFPKAVLRGTISEFESIPEDGLAHNATLVGTLEMHGVKDPVIIPIRIKRTADTYEIAANFDIYPSTFNIQIPSVVRNKIAETIKVSVNALLRE